MNPFGGFFASTLTCSDFFFVQTNLMNPFGGSFATARSHPFFFRGIFFRGETNPASAALFDGQRWNGRRVRSDGVRHYAKRFITKILRFWKCSSRGQCMRDVWSQFSFHQNNTCKWLSAHSKPGSHSLILAISYNRILDAYHLKKPLQKK